MPTSAANNLQSAYFFSLRAPCWSCTSLASLVSRQRTTPTCLQDHFESSRFSISYSSSKNSNSRSNSSHHVQHRRRLLRRRRRSGRFQCQHQRHRHPQEPHLLWKAHGYKKGSLGCQLSQYLCHYLLRDLQGNHLSRTLVWGIFCRFARNPSLLDWILRCFEI